jgi:hypothetical protein
MLALAFSPRINLGSQLENRPPAHLVPVSCTEQPDCGILGKIFDYDCSLFATVTSSRVRDERQPPFALAKVIHEFHFLELGISPPARFCLMASANCPKCACFAVICLHDRTRFVSIAVLVIHLSTVGTDGEAIESIRRASGCPLNAFYCGDLRAVSAPPVHTMQY